MNFTRYVGDVKTIFEFRPHTLEPAAVSFSTLDTALTLGAGQRKLAEDLSSYADDLKVKVVLRDNGGGAVWLEPECQLWLGLYYPSSTGFLAQDYRSELMHLGEAARTALEDIGLDNLDVVTGPDNSSMGRYICFAGRSYGEITTYGRKILGISLRRTKSWKIYHLMLPIFERQYKIMAALRHLEVEATGHVDWTALEAEVPHLTDLEVIVRRSEVALVSAISQVSI